MKSATFLMSFVMLAIFSTMVGIAFSYPVQSRFMPLVVGIPAILLCLLQITLDIRTARHKGAKKPQRDPRSTIERASETLAEGNVLHMPAVPSNMIIREITLWAYFLGVVAGVLMFGFWFTIPVFLLFFLHFEAEFRWWKGTLTAALCTGALYLIVTRVLRFELHEGFIFTFLYSL